MFSDFFMAVMYGEGRAPVVKVTCALTSQSHKKIFQESIFESIFIVSHFLLSHSRTHTLYAPERVRLLL